MHAWGGATFSACRPLRSCRQLPTAPTNFVEATLLGGREVLFDVGRRPQNDRDLLTCAPPLVHYIELL